MAMRRWLIGIGLGIALWLGFGYLGQFAGQGLYATAQSDARLESRLNRLESDLSRLGGQIRQIQAQLAIPNRPAPNRPPVELEPSLTEPSLDEQFDNLATLAIELKQQLRQLEARVSQLERALPR